MLRLASLAVLLALAPAAHAQLSGTYNIDGSRPTSSRSFQTFGEATTALESQGVSGAVVFRVAYGAYLEQITLGAIPGAGRVNTVTFEGIPDAFGRLPALGYAATSSGRNWVVRVDGTFFVTFEGLQIRPLGTAYARGFVFGRQSLAVTVRDCAFLSTGYTGSPTQTEGALVYGNSSDVGSEHTVTGSTFSSSVGRGIYFRGTPASRALRLTLSDNVITGTTRYGIDVRYLTEATVSGNTVDTEGGIAAVYSNGLVLEGNRLRASGAHALYLFDIDAQGADRSLVANNFLSTTGAFATAHITSSTSELDFVHNTVYQDASGEAALDVASSSVSDLTVVNNILYSPAGSTPFQMASASSMSQANFNLLYSDGGPVAVVGGRGYATLAAYRSGTGFGTDSRSKAVTFFDAANGDFRLFGTSRGDWDLRGTPLASVPRDIDNALRSTETPYMGADEALPLLVPPPLAGTYTLGGGQPTGGTHYQTFADATAALAVRSVSADVTFEVAYGTYAEQVTVPAFGNPTGATVRFLGLLQSGPPATGIPLLTYTPTVSSGWIVKVGAPNVVVENFRIQPAGQPADGAVGVLVASDQSTLSRLVILDIARGVVYSTSGSGVGTHLLSETRIDDVTERGVLAENLGAAGLTITQTDSRSVSLPDVSFVGIDITDVGGMARLDRVRSDATRGVALRLHNVQGETLVRNSILSSFAGSSIEATLTPQFSLQASTILTGPISGPGVSIGPSDSPAQLDNLILGHRGNGPYLQASPGAVGHAEHIVYSTYERFSSFAVEWDGATVESVEALRTVSGTHTVADTVTVVHRQTVSQNWPSLAERSDGDASLIGAPLPGVTVDVQGDPRSPSYPYVGADEAPTPLTPPPPPLDGIYTIDPNGSGDRNFATFADAVGVLEAVGVNAPVTFQVYEAPDPGIQTNVYRYPNAGADRAVRFEAAPGQTPDLYSVRTYRLEHATFEGIDFSERLDVGPGSRHLVVRSGLAGRIGVESSQRFLSHHIQIEGMTDLRGGIAVDSTDHVTIMDNQVTILDNISTADVFDVRLAGIWVQGSDSARVVGNTVAILSESSGLTGILVEPSRRLFYFSGYWAATCYNAEVLRNDVQQAESPAEIYDSLVGLNITCNNVRAEENRVLIRDQGVAIRVRTQTNVYNHLLPRRVGIYNNMASAGDGTAMQIDIGSGAGGYEVINNTLANDSATRQTFDGGRVEDVNFVRRDLYFKNNIVSNAGTGRAATLIGWSNLTLGTSATLWSADNVFSTAGAEPLAVYKNSSTLTPYSSVDSFNADYDPSGYFGAPSNSIDVDFVDRTSGDLHLAPSMHGEPSLASIRHEDTVYYGQGATTDFDGEARPGLTYRGADEPASAPLDQPSSALVVTVLLQGPYDAASGLMRTDLRDGGHLPLAQPYADAAFDGTALDYDGTEVTTAAVLAEHAVVDWVLLDVRREPGLAPFARLAALLLADGSVMAPDGSGPPELDAFGTFNVVVRHRNHVSGMSTSSANGSVDMTAAIYNGFLGGAVELSPGRWALWAGDADGNGSVLADDRQSVWLPAVGAAGYQAADLDLDGSVLANDRQLYLDPNVGRASQVPGAASLTGSQTETRAAGTLRGDMPAQRPTRRRE